MNRLRRNWVSAGLVWVAGLLNGEVVEAQNAASPAPAPGVQMVPVPVPMFIPSVPGGSSDPATAGTGTGAQANIFSNPYAAPLLYNSMLSPSPTPTPTPNQAGSSAASSALPPGQVVISPGEMGLLMLATQRPLGIGSGQLSGARPGQSGDARRSRGKTTVREPGGRSRGPAQPGGLAARYFNRVAPHSPYPQNYFNRQNRYFP
jgi:hypothetical protein